MKRSDQRTRLTNMMIRRAFTSLLGQKPIQSISVKELCAEAGINRGTFYARYADVYDLLEKMESEMMEDFQAALAPLLSDPTADLTPVKITAEIFRCIKDNADLCAVTLGPYGDKEFAAKLLGIGRERCVESYRKYFEHASQKQIEYYYAFVSSGCIGLLQQWLSEGMTDSAENVAQMAEGIMFSGIHFLAQTET